MWLPCVRVAQNSSGHCCAPVRQEEEHYPQGALFSGHESRFCDTAEPVLCTSFIFRIFADHRFANMTIYTITNCESEVMHILR